MFLALNVNHAADLNLFTMLIRIAFIQIPLESEHEEVFHLYAGPFKMLLILSLDNLRYSFGFLFAGACFFDVSDIVRPEVLILFNL